MDMHNMQRTVVCRGFIVVERTRDAKGREKFITVSPRRYHSREAASHFFALIKAQNPRGDYHLREDMGTDDIPQPF